MSKQRTGHGYRRHGLLSRRAFSGGLLAGWGMGLGMVDRVLAANPSGRMGPASRFDRAVVLEEARRRAQTPYHRRLALHATRDFDEHVRLSYGAADEVAGCLRLFPAQRATAPDAVTIHIVEGGVEGLMAREIINTSGLFGYGGTADTAGFRAINPDGGGDWLAYLGASYFRASGPSGQYGLSARAVAVNTGIDNTEEFPAFTDLWIQQQGEQRLMIHALVDGPSLTGAFAFDTQAGPAATVQTIRASLFFRRDVKRLGLAPITTMFDFSPGHFHDGEHGRGDWRPAVHDSDGLAIRNGTGHNGTGRNDTGELLWRPLDNPVGPKTNMIRADHLKGFGMIQRDRTFADYQDDYASFNRRPSLWVEPQGDWGPGGVMLYEMNADSENIDNMAAMWISDHPALAGQRRDFAYRLIWSDDDPSIDHNAHSVHVFTGPGGVPGGEVIAGATRFVVDFQGPVLQGLGRTSGVTAVTNLPGPALLWIETRPVEGQDAMWRVTMDVRTQGLVQDDFRLFLKHGTQAISETVLKTVRP